VNRYNRLPRVLLSIICICAVVAVNFNAAALSTWTETGNAFSQGEKVATRVKEEALQLDNNESYIGNWTKLQDGLPSPRAEHAMVYDSLGGVAILFGGTHRNDQEEDNETWTYNFTSDTWTLKSLLSPPRARFAHAMAFDSANGVVVLFGGYLRGWGILGDTWTYNLSTNTWTGLTPSPAPLPRADAAMTYDPGSGEAVLFGGHYNGRQLNDTWTYNVRNNVWTNKTTSSGPPGREQHAMVFDSKSGVSILFGGSSTPTGPLCDTWAYDSSANTWKNMAPAAYPPARSGHAMAYDVRNGLVLMFSDNEMYTPDETWAYKSSLNTWTNMKPAEAPPIRYGCVILGDPVYGGCILFGGIGETGVDITGTWSYRPGTNTWTRKEDPVPGPRIFHDMVFDSANRVMVLFGGEIGLNLATDDTWIYDILTGQWTRRRPATSPPARQAHAMAYDSANGVVVLFGGMKPIQGGYTFYNDTWLYDAKQNTWSQRPASPAPSARYNHKMAYDSARGIVVLFGGGYGGSHGDVWTYNVSRNAWTEMASSSTSSPSMRESCAMTYDPVRSLVVLFGGYDGRERNDTWTYDAGSDKWARMTPPAPPQSAVGAAMAFDADNRMELLFGGSVSYTKPTNETWMYDIGGNSWTKKAPARSPYSRTLHSMSYDNLSRAMVVFGGTYDDLSGYMLGDTWVYDLKVYPPAGNYTSRPLDTKGSAYFGTIRWDIRTSVNTNMKIGIRTANTSEELNGRPFLGPDGKNDSHYLVSGQRIAGCHNGDRWVQYRVSLGTYNVRDTPVLRNVTIEYNLLHAVNITSPAGGERWCAAYPVTWRFADQDGDKITFDLYLLNDTAAVKLAANLPFGTTRWDWDTRSFPEGTYRMKVVARDPNLRIPLTAESISGPFEVYRNLPPAVELATPAPGAIITETRAELSWNGSDPNGDRLNYSVFISQDDPAQAPLPEPETVTGDTSYNAASLVDGRTYFWAVLANDGYINGSLSEVRTFTVRLPRPNNPPTVLLLTPADKAILNGTEALLTWRGNDPDGDKLSFRLMLTDKPFNRTGIPLPLAVTGDEHYLAGNLTNGTVYYWAVLPADGMANGSLSEIRSFRIDIGYGNRPPRITSQPPDKAVVGIIWVYNITTVDDDGDPINYSLASGPEGAALDPGSGRLTWSPRADQKGRQQFRILAADRRGGLSEQSFTVTVIEVSPPAQRPGCILIYPPPNSTVSKKVQIKGTATPGALDLVRVEVRIDSGQWMVANGTGNWTLELDSTKLTNGQHRIEARAFDGMNYSEPATMTINVNNPKPRPSKGFIPGFEAAVTIGIVALTLLARSKRK